VGIVGLFFFLWILRELWIISRPRAPSLGDGTYVQTATVLIRVLLFTFMLDQTKIDYLRNGTYSFFAWFLFGLVYAVGNVARAEEKERALAKRLGFRLEGGPIRDRWSVGYTEGPLYVVPGPQPLCPRCGHWLEELAPTGATVLARRRSSPRLTHRLRWF